MNVLEKLKNKEAFSKELEAEGLMLVDIEAEKPPQIDITEEDLEDPKKLMAKFNGILAKVHADSNKRIKKATADATDKVTKDVQKTFSDNESDKIRKFLSLHANVDQKDPKHKDTLELMDYYYAHGDDLDKAYTKACKATDCEPGPATTSEENKGESAPSKVAKTQVSSQKSSEHSSSSRQNTNEEGDEKKKKPLTIREAAKESLAEVTASAAGEGNDDPFGFKEQA